MPFTQGTSFLGRCSILGNSIRGGLNIMQKTVSRQVHTRNRTHLARNFSSSASNTLQDSVAQSQVQHFPVESVTDLVAGVQYSLESFHLTTGSPWWLTFGATAIAVRIALFPVVLKSLRNAKKLGKTGPDIIRVNQAFYEVSGKFGLDTPMRVRMDKLKE